MRINLVNLRLVEGAPYLSFVEDTSLGWNITLTLAWYPLAAEHVLWVFPWLAPKPRS